MLGDFGTASRIISRPMAGMPPCIASKRTRSRIRSTSVIGRHCPGRSANINSSRKVSKPKLDDRRT